MFFCDEGSDPFYDNGYFCPPNDNDGNYLYPCTINNPDSDTVLIDGVVFLPNIHSDSEKEVHAYLTDDTHYIKVGEKLYYTALNSDYLEVNEVAVGSAFSITATKDGEALVYGTDYTYPAGTGVLTILSDTPVKISNTDKSNSTTNTIVVASGVSANITLNGVNIDIGATENACAFKIEDGSEGNVTITLADGSENTLTSGSNCAGLQKNGGIGKLTITGKGTLTAVGGEFGAGIGGGYMGVAENIVIENATVTAQGDSGIGSGNQGGSANGRRS